MKPRQQRMLAVGLALTGLVVATALVLRAADDNMMFFVDVSDVLAGDYPADRNFRVGGLVVDGSIDREPDSLDVEFLVTDTRCQLPVRYSGVLPDLFRDGQGVVAHGRLDDGGVFVADEIMAKHDENYIAPEVAESIARHVGQQTADLDNAVGECGPQ